LYRLACEYRQFQLQTVDADIHVVLSKKYKVLWREDVLDVPREQVLGHNRKKRYILDDDMVHPFLVRLGVQAEDGLIRQRYYDKFRQINRFLEFVEDSLEYLPQDRTVRILDFGSGKSYLTFALYYYLHVIKEFDVRITGLDLKEEVILQCQAIARELGYDDGLDFSVGNIHDYGGVDSVGMVVTLHACDVATDMALARAVRWGARVILSVPCCQHELNGQLDAANLDVMLQHGLVKERFAALATDSMRAEMLGLVGYDVQLLEFIDMDHTPKNILIRAYETGRVASDADRDKYTAFRDMLGARPYLERELGERLGLGEKSVF